MGEQITIFSQNCQGLSLASKRRDLFHFVKNKKYNIICLQDVHINNKMEDFVKNEWGYNAYFSSYSTNSRGVMTLINNNFEQKVEQIKTDTNGNYLLISITMHEKKITLVNVYGPNQDNPQFYRTLFNKISEFDNDQIIMCGDWNFILNPDIDYENYVHINNPRSRQTMLEFLEENNILDIWRIMNEEKKQFTWRRLNPVRKQARLDFFLISDNLSPFVTDTQIIPGFRTDHNSILLKLKFQEGERGPGYWKFNNMLLKDKEYVKIVKKTISEVKQTYVINENDLETTSNETIQFNINDQLFLETLLMIIRGNTIKYSSEKKKKSKIEEIKLEKEIEILEQEINDNIGTIDHEKFQILEQKKTNLVNIRRQKIEGVMLRSKCRYQDLGEKPTKYFLNLENRNYTNKTISKLIDEDGKEYTETKDILNLQKDFYKKLYSKNEDLNEENIEMLIGENSEKLSDLDSEKLEGEIKYSELLQALKNMKNDKSPGQDGFTSEFFKFFWVDIGYFILRSLNFAYSTGSLSVTQKMGIITCLPKPNKNRQNLKNWRPISLLNVIYKMASSVIANRLKNVLDTIIHEDQKGFISGRFLGENVRLIYDVLYETKSQELPGLILSIDFEKAFDTVSWEFINKTLVYYNLGPSIRKWISLFQHGAESCIIQNGFMSESFTLKRGCRQGDPISPYIFILCAEILGKMIRKNEDIKGITINNKEYKLSQYADDTQIFLDGSENALNTTLSVLHRFYKISGLKLNVEKTKAIWIGAFSHSEIRLCENYDLDWSQGPFRVLGVNFSSNVFDIWDLNTNEVLNKIENLVAHWSKRKITLPGRITVIKSLMLSKFTHLFLALPNPPGDFIRKLERILYKFLWNSGPDRIKRSVIIKNLDAGGLRMINIQHFINALKVSWFRRVIQNSNSSHWYSLSNIEFETLFNMGSGYSLRVIENISNPFWKDILQSWNKFCDSVNVQTIYQILNSPIWYNKNLMQGANVFIKNWYEKGIRLVSDLLDQNGNFYDFESFKTTYDVAGTFLDYQRLIFKIPEHWKNNIRANSNVYIINRFNVTCSLYTQFLMKDKKGCRRIYDLMIKANETNLENKWVREIGVLNEHDLTNYNNVMKDLKEVTLKDFQFKINNKILVTKSFLYHIGKIDDNHCSYCNENIESIYHLFVECDKVKRFWQELRQWLLSVSNLSLMLEEKNILFSYQGKNQLINYIFTLAKHYIYKTKFYTNELDINAFKAILKDKCRCEKYIAYLNNNLSKFLSKWGPLYNILVNNT